MLDPMPGQIAKLYRKLRQSNANAGMCIVRSIWLSDVLAALCDFAHNMHVVAVDDELVLSLWLVDVGQLELQSHQQIICRRPALVESSVGMT